MEKITTKELLRSLGREEFLAKGYKDASLREIGKKSGFTLGAFYGYYPSKEALFEGIVKDGANALYDRFLQAQNEFSSLPEEQQEKELNYASDHGLQEMIDMIYEDFDVFKLLFFRAEGTKYEDYLQRFIDVEIESTFRFIEVLKKQGHTIDVDEDLVHILVSAMFSGMLEVVDHDMGKEKAVRHVTQLHEFYSAGWHQLFGM